MTDLANYYVLRWDEETLSYKVVETWGIKNKEVESRYEKLCKEYGKNNLVVTANLSVVTRADVRSMIRRIDAKVREDCRKRKEANDKRLSK